MATLSQHFHLGRERHRAADDCALTLSVMKRVGIALALPSILDALGCHDDGRSAEKSQFDQSSEEAALTSDMQTSANILDEKRFSEESDGVNGARDTLEEVFLYLKMCKSIVKSSQTSRPIIFVIGNEAMDLDSHVSSISFAYFSHVIQQRQLDISSSELAPMYIPLLNLEREDFVLRGECVSLFESLNFSIDDLIFLGLTHTLSFSLSFFLSLSLSLSLP